VVEFYRETGFKETEIGKVPKDWMVITLEKASLKIKTGPFGSQLKKSELTEGGIKVYTQENILRHNFSSGNLYISPEKFEKLKSMEVRPGDVLLTIRGSVGCSAVFPKNAEKGIIHTNLAYIRVKRELLLPEFLSALINECRIVKAQIINIASATTLGALYAKHIKQIKIPLPPSVNEQKRIVQILYSMDEAIRAVEASIDKYERLKKGLMQELLTKGIGHKEFKETEMGRIPKDWDIVKLGRVVKYEKGKNPSRLFDRYNQNLIPYLTAEYLRGLSPPKWCSPEDPRVVRVNGKDIIMIWDGSYSGYVFTGFEGALASTMVKIIPNREFDALFLYYVLDKKFPVLHGTTVGTGIPHVNKMVFENMLVPKPPLPEQQKIAKILRMVDEVIELKKKKREKLEKTKKAIMNLLLTGKVRVRA